MSEKLTFRNCDFIDFPDFHGCDICLKEGTSPPGMITWQVNGLDYSKTCNCQIIWRELHRTKRELGYGCFPKYTWNFHLTDTYVSEHGASVELPEIYTYLDKHQEVCKLGMNLWFFGQHNTQKTSVASFIGKYFIFEKHFSYYISFENLLRYLERNRFNREGEGEEIDYLQRATLLIIDDIPASIPENSSINLLHGFLLDRIARALPHIYISVRDLKGLAVGELKGEESLKVLFEKNTKELHLTSKVRAKDRIEKFYER